jgi:hypothetical protein
MEISKSDKKIAKEIIDAGLQKEFAKGLDDARLILNDQLTNGAANRETYHLLFGHIYEFDKHIASRYDGMKPSRYISIIAAQLYEGYNAEQDLEPLSEEVKAAIKIDGK